MKIVISGGAGFIGVAAACELLKRGHEVVLFDHATEARWTERTGDLVVNGAANRYRVRIPGGAESGEWGRGRFALGDVRDRRACRRAVRGCDAVIHSAAIHVVTEIIEEPVEAVQINVHGTLNMLEAAVAAGVPRFVFLSSAKVYGEPARVPSEENDILRPLETYALAKCVSEEYCRRFGEEGRLETVALRPFSVYGPGQNIKNGYIGFVLDALCNDGTAVLPGAKGFRRDFTYIDDMSRLAADAAILPGLSSHVLNAGSGKSCTLPRLLALVEKVSAMKVPARYVTPRNGTICRTHAGMGRVEDVLGFVPQVSLEEGLRRTYEWYREGGHGQ